MRDRYLIVSLAATVVVLLLFVSASFRAGRLKKGFREEMAQRLDLEEKLLAFENHQKGFLEQLGVLKKENNGLKEELSALKVQFLREQREKAAFKGALQRAEAQLRIRTEAVPVVAATPGEKSAIERGESSSNISSRSAAKNSRREF